jgi:hypothetical protein
MADLETKVVAIDKTTIIDNAAAPPPLGPVILELPSAPASCHDALSCTLITAEPPATGEKFLVIISAAEVLGAPRLGTLAQFTPDEARSFAASMLVSADECDGGQRGAN